MRSINFAQISLHPVSHHRTAYFPRDRATEFTSFMFPPDHIADKRAAH